MNATTMAPWSCRNNLKTQVCVDAQYHVCMLHLWHERTKLERRGCSWKWINVSSYFLQEDKTLRTEIKEWDLIQYQMVGWSTKFSSYLQQSAQAGSVPTFRPHDAQMWSVVLQSGITNGSQKRGQKQISSNIDMEMVKQSIVEETMVRVFWWQCGHWIGAELLSKKKQVKNKKWAHKSWMHRKR